MKELKLMLGRREMALEFLIRGQNTLRNSSTKHCLVSTLTRKPKLGAPDFFKNAHDC